MYEFQHSYIHNWWILILAILVILANFVTIKLHLRTLKEVNVGARTSFQSGGGP